MALDFGGQAGLAPSAPILEGKSYNAPSVFTAGNMLREARRQKNLPDASIPPVCVLDPDGDLLRALRANGQAETFAPWACYHTELFTVTHDGLTFGIIGNAVGAAFSVLLAEQAFASGAELLISVTSAGQIVPAGPAPYFILIDRALRDEGTSYHYLPPAQYALADAALIGRVEAGLRMAGFKLHKGAAWTTDAPFRETAAAIEAARAMGILCVEMEAAALYAFAQARQVPVLCFAQVTNQMAQGEGEFEKGEANGAHDALALMTAAARAARP